MPRKRRVRSPHPGVVILRGNEHHGPRARWTDPDTRKVRIERLEVTGPAARAWAKKKANELAARRRELEAGATPLQGAGLTTAIEDYFSELHARPTTVSTYRISVNTFERWAAKVARPPLVSVDDVAKERLRSFRAWLVKQPRRVTTTGDKRGGKKEADPRSPHSVNHDLRAVGSMLQYLRKAGRLPRLTSDGISEGLEHFSAPKDPPEFLKPDQVKALISACLDHDQATFKATRKEHASGQSGATFKYEPIGPFVVFVLLSGCRLAESLGLRWESITMTAPSQIELAGADTKTSRGRLIDLQVSPALFMLLEAIRPAKATGKVFTGLTRDSANAGRKRLIGEHKAPSFDWQLLRSTCSTYLTNAPGIFGAASAYRSAKQLGHSVQIAEGHYAGVTRVNRDATSIETALEIWPEPMIGFLRWAVQRYDPKETMLVRDLVGGEG
jgi:integrase